MFPPACDSVGHHLVYNHTAVHALHSSNLKHCADFLSRYYTQIMHTPEEVRHDTSIRLHHTLQNYLLAHVIQIAN